MFCLNDPFIGCVPYKNKEDYKKWCQENRLYLNGRKQQYRKRVGRKEYPEKNAEWRERNRDRCCFNALRGRAKYLYGIPLDEYAAVQIRAMTEPCEICGKKPSREASLSHRKLHIDHPKGERRMRGLICNYCNMGLGNFRDNIEILQSAIEYLMADSARKAYA
jgi:recombination endonuclease VII